MRSNRYTLGFTAAVTIVLGLLLSLAATSLQERQRMNVEIDMKKNILRSLGIPADPEKVLSPQEIQDTFDHQVEGIVADRTGKLVPGMRPQDLDLRSPAHLPVYLKKSAGNITGYAIPISGKGLWSTLYGYLAVEPDGNTVMGLTFYQHGETPGLGGEVEKDWFTSNFVGKKIFDTEGKLVSITVVKGQADPGSSGFEHEVDGISGATMTAKGLNSFLKQDLQAYEPFFRSLHKREG